MDSPQPTPTCGINTLYKGVCKVCGLKVKLKRERYSHKQWADFIKREIV